MKKKNMHIHTHTQDKTAYGCLLAWCLLPYTLHTHLERQLGADRLVVGEQQVPPGVSDGGDVSRVAGPPQHTVAPRRRSPFFIGALFVHLYITS